MSKDTNYIEVCPNCMEEIEGEFDTSLPHRQTVCPKCGKTLYLCGIWPFHEETYEDCVEFFNSDFKESDWHPCDWHFYDISDLSKGGTCSMSKKENETKEVFNMKYYFIVERNEKELFKSEDFSEVKQWIYDNDDVKDLFLRSKLEELDDDKIEEDIDYNYGNVEVCGRYLSTIDILKAVGEYNDESLFEECIDERRQELLEEYFWDELFFEVQSDWDNNYCEDGDSWQFDYGITIRYIKEEENPTLIKIRQLEALVENITQEIKNLKDSLNET